MIPATEPLGLEYPQFAQRVSLAALALIWAVLAAAKALSPHQFQQFIVGELGLPRSTSWLIVSCEALISIAGMGAALTHGLLARKLRRTVVISTIAACAASLYISLTVSTPCGCFGVIAQATQGRRLMVIGAMLILCGLVWMPTGRPLNLREPVQVERSSKEG